MKKLAVAVLVAAVFAIGCNQFVSTAINTLAAAQGVIAQEQQTHQAQCQQNPAQALCLEINQAVDAQNAAITGLEAYCQLPAPPTPAQLAASGTSVCNANPSAKAALESQLKALSTIVAQIQGK